MYFVGKPFHLPRGMFQPQTDRLDLAECAQATNILAGDRHFPDSMLASGSYEYIDRYGTE